MVPDQRRLFNASFTGDGYQRFVRELQRRAGPVGFRLSETPCFFPLPLLDRLTRTGAELVAQLVGSADYRRASDRTIPPEFNAPGEGEHPLFIQVDFGLVCEADGTVTPRLVELQGFASLYAFQPLVAAHRRRLARQDRRVDRPGAAPQFPPRFGPPVTPRATPAS